MKRVLFALVIICGVGLSESFAKKPKKVKMTDEERQTQIDSLKREFENFQEEQRSKIVYFDTVRIDSGLEVPVYRDYNLRLMMPMIHYNNPVMYMKFAFGDTDKDKYYCAIGRGEAETYGNARHEALIDAVQKIREDAGESVILSSAELLMSEEDKWDNDFMEHLKEKAQLEGDTVKFALLQEKENKHIVKVAIRIPKNN